MIVLSLQVNTLSPSWHSPTHVAQKTNEDLPAQALPALQDLHW